MLPSSFCVCALSLSRVQRFATPWAVAHQVPLFMEFSSREYWSGLPFPTPGDLPDSGIEPSSLASLVLAGGFFTTEPPGKPTHILLTMYKFSLLLSKAKLVAASLPCLSTIFSLVSSFFLFFIIKFSCSTRSYSSVYKHAVTSPIARNQQEVDGTKPGWWEEDL